MINKKQTFTKMLNAYVNSISNSETTNNESETEQIANITFNVVKKETMRACKK